VITLLNTSIITSYGTFKFEPIDLERAKSFVQPTECNCYDSRTCLYCAGSGTVQPSFDSAIGHESTAEILTELLGVKVPVNRQNYIQTPGATALVFKLKQRAPEGVILGKEEIERIGYEFGLLTRTA